MSYKTLLFDADNTLLDFRKTEAQAMTRTFAKYGIPYNQRTKDVYEEINQGLWKEFEAGKIEKKEVLNRRFQETFQAIGVKPPADFAFEKDFQLALGEGGYLIDGALELCRALSKDRELYIVTNGVTATQKSRMERCGLKPYIKGVFVSEEVGYQKPRKEYFQYVFDRIPGLELSRTLIIGDTLSSDIKGGNAAGIDTCWYNPCRKSNTTDAVVTYEITRLEELWDIV